MARWFDHSSADPFDRGLELQDLSKSMPIVEQRTKAPVRSTRSSAPPPSPPPAAAPTPASRKPAHVYRHGDAIEYQHGAVVGRGRIVGSTMSHVVIRDGAGREHHVRHEALLPPEEGASSVDVMRHWV